MGGRKCTLRDWVVLCIVFVTMLPDTVDDSSTSTTLFNKTYKGFQGVVLCEFGVFVFIFFLTRCCSRFFFPESTWSGGPLESITTIESCALEIMGQVGEWS